jgi:flavin reductase (DIM6/NTAB) family NADH-FMN oxidoreductase RutF
LAHGKKIDTRDFRRALSAFATGVGIVTTVDQQGRYVGITISSFNSVSLEPPLILWSVGLDSMSYDAFVAAEHFAVHVLALHQMDLCDRFAQRSENKFDGVEVVTGLHGVPLLSDFAACFECSTEHVYAGGDHKIIVGRVHRAEQRKAEPLIYYRSKFLGIGRESG